MIENTVLIEDMKRTVQNGLPYQQLQGACILVTGANGLIGSQMIKTLFYLNDEKKLNLQVIVAVRNIKKAVKMFGENKSLTYYEYDLEKEITIERKIDYIIHCAAPTQSKQFIEYPSEVIKSIINGTIHSLECAKKHQAKLIFLSSMEIYGVESFKNGEYIQEDDYGYINLLNVRNSYVEGKRVSELLCHSYAKEYQVEICIARLCQTFGVGVQKEDKRMFAQFANAVLENRNITLFSSGETVRSYCYISDAIRALFYLMVFGESGEAYNVANEEMTMPVKEIAHLVAKHYGVKVEYQIEENENKGYLPVLQMKMNTKKMKALGWKPEIGMLESFERMIKSMEEIEK